jgi:hypothetical protein
MPTATLHSGLFNSKSTTEPATKAPIHAHQPTNSALVRFMSVNILGFIVTTSVHTLALLGAGIISPHCCVKSGCSHGWRWRCSSDVSRLLGGHGELVSPVVATLVRPAGHLVPFNLP